MASSTTAVLYLSSLNPPNNGTFPMAANTLYPFGTIVTRDSSGRARSPSTADVSGRPAMGVAKHTYNNLTGNGVTSGLDDADDVQVAYGPHGFVFTGATPKVGDLLYVVDNQTLSVDSLLGTRGVAGVCTEVQTIDATAYAFCNFGPHAASLGGDAMANVPIALASFLDADGDPLAKFVNAASPTFGFALADSEALCLRWNNDAAPGTALNQIAIPADLDSRGSMSLEFLCSKSGATLADATTLTITAFLIAPGDLHDADANAGGVTGALVGNATAKTTALLTRTIAAADIPAGAKSMTFTVTPTAGTLGTDDLMIHDVRLRYQRKAA